MDEAAARALARHLVENGSHGVVVAGTTGESPTLSDEEDVALLRAVEDEVGGEATVICGTGTNDTRHSEHLTRRGGRGRRRRGPGRDAVLQQAQPGRDPGATTRRSPRPPATPGDRLQHPLAGGRSTSSPTCSPSWARSTTSSRSSRPNNDEIDQIEGLEVLAGNDDIFLRCLETGGDGRDPRRLAPGRQRDARDLRRDAGGRRRPRPARSTRASGPSTTRSTVTTQPDPGQGRPPRCWG